MKFQYSNILKQGIRNIFIFIVTIDLKNQGEGLKV